ncbi:phosphoglycolate phosphatase-like protein [Methylophaga frappieri]|uniref:phosphoglycolate phosphatase n=1 Tax=Methylophaga frappieri (strain ATCC BAA-2434 / DSM 25690 / JAM7) TaxID=754477 RepID=I1YGW2_METFJ|nr:phosphoglycolate phosphatase [Methylophaga frappieri]AFJ02155.1 phosphoglycolate phosphatase-like protein [Methylophaga frappieri]
MILSRFTVLLLDLDGTLVDTAPDLAYALNQLLQEQGKSPLDYALIRPVASHGSAGLLKLGFGLTPDDAQYRTFQQRFLQLYADNIDRESRLFLGMEKVLDTLTEQGRRWGVVTNKPAFLTDPLMSGLNLSERAACIVSGDTTAHSKPHPAPLLHACELMDVPAADCIYIGDAERDIQAAKNAGMRSVVARYGYLQPDEQPEHWQADCIINHPLEILQWTG